MEVPQLVFYGKNYPTYHKLKTFKNSFSSGLSRPEAHCGWFPPMFRVTFAVERDAIKRKSPAYNFCTSCYPKPEYEGDLC